MKRLLSIALAVTMLMSVLSGCGKNQGYDEQTEELTSSAEVETTEETTEETTTTTTKKEIKKSVIKEAYAEALKDNKYEATGASVAQDIPDYTLYDFDKDGTPELLIWDVRLASAIDRDIFVYKFNSNSQKAEKIGKMVDFEGHSNFGESKDKDGIVIATRDNGTDDAVKKYTLKDGGIVSETILAKTSESYDEWYDIFTSSEYFSSTEFEIYFDTDHLNEIFG